MLPSGGLVLNRKAGGLQSAAVGDQVAFLTGRSLSTSQSSRDSDGQTAKSHRIMDGSTAQAGEGASNGLDVDVEVVSLGLTDPVATMPSGLWGWWKKLRGRWRMQSAVNRVFEKSALLPNAKLIWKASAASDLIHNARSVRELLVSEAEEAEKEAARQREMLTEGIVFNVYEDLLRRQDVWKACGETTGADAAVVQPALTSIYRLANAGELSVEGLKVDIEEAFKSVLRSDVRTKVEKALDSVSAGCKIRMRRRTELSQVQQVARTVETMILLFRNAAQGKVDVSASAQRRIGASRPPASNRRGASAHRRRSEAISSSAQSKAHRPRTAQSTCLRAQSTCLRVAPRPPHPATRPTHRRDDSDPTLYDQSYSPVEMARIKVALTAISEAVEAEALRESDVIDVGKEYKIQKGVETAVDKTMERVRSRLWWREFRRWFWSERSGDSGAIPWRIVSIALNSVSKSIMR